MKKVHFDPGKPVVHVMHVWKYAYRTARHGEWQQMACDRERFKMRIEGLSKIIDPVLKKKYNDYLRNKQL